MNYPTLNEVEALVRSAFEGDYDGDDFDIEVRRDGDGYVIEMTKMYSYVRLNLSSLLTLANFFGTMNVNDSRYHSNGCETCDYGSSYKVTLTVQP